MFKRASIPSSRTYVEEIISSRTKKIFLKKTRKEKSKFKKDKFELFTPEITKIGMLMPFNHIDTIIEEHSEVIEHPLMESDHCSLKFITPTDLDSKISIDSKEMKEVNEFIAKEMDILDEIDIRKYLLRRKESFIDNYLIINNERQVLTVEQSFTNNTYQKVTIQELPKDDCKAKICIENNVDEEKKTSLSNLLTNLPEISSCDSYTTIFRKFHQMRDQLLDLTNWMKKTNFIIHTENNDNTKIYKETNGNSLIEKMSHLNQSIQNELTHIKKYSQLLKAELIAL